jgi:hypothetical protein
MSEQIRVRKSRVDRALEALLPLGAAETRELLVAWEKADPDQFELMRLRFVRSHALLRVRDDSILFGDVQLQAENSRH